MSAMRPAHPDGDDEQDWPDDVALDLLLLSAHDSGLSALAQAIDTEQGLAVILTRRPSDRPAAQRPDDGQLPGPAASRSPPSPAQPRQRDQKSANHRNRSTP